MIVASFRTMRNHPICAIRTVGLRIVQAGHGDKFLAFAANGSFLEIEFPETVDLNIIEHQEEEHAGNRK